VIQRGLYSEPCQYLIFWFDNRDRLRSNDVKRVQLATLESHP
jgi:hypothetical protein